MTLAEPPPPDLARRSGAAPFAADRHATSALSAASVFLSAFLLFLVQPMVARMLLPRFGGSPAVWTTALVFFQAALLAGYAYAHASTARLGPRAQAGLHAALVAAAALALPPRLPAAAAPGGWPVPALLAALAAMIGAPFVVLAANSSLVQHWWARGPGARGGDPYPLYAASNAGSLLALAAYPFVLEPLLGLRAQAVLLAAGYAAFALLTLRLLGGAARGAPDAAGDPAGVAPRREGARTTDAPADSSAALPADSPATLPPSRGLFAPPAAVPQASAARAARWVARSATASALLVASSLAITTDVAAVPLLWVVPLALYLATFVAAFGSPWRVPRGLVVAATVASVCAALVAMALPLGSLAAVLAPPLCALLFGALLCHGDLAAERPPPSELTAYYLWIAVGGALGGALCSLVAPVVFDRVAEYPLALVALAFLVAVPPGGARRSVRPTARRPTASAWVPAAAMAALAAVTAHRLAYAPPAERANWLVVAPLLLLYGAALASRPGRFGLAAALFALVHATGFAASQNVVAQERGFFGVLRVRETSTTRALLHGTTMHGTQPIGATEDELRRPGGYYHPEGPLGRPLAELGPGADIGIVGLGTGALAAVARPGQRIVYYEIDPLVERLARAHFGYLAASPADVRVVLGDGRLALESAPDGAFDLLVVDAFTSDAVPVHLLTAEALDLYLRKTAPEGLVVLHVSNRHLDLARVLYGYAEDRGAPMAYALWEPSAAAAAEGAAWTEAVALSPSPERLAAVLAQPGWRPRPEGEPVRWTDDRSSVVGVLRW